MALPRVDEENLALRPNVAVVASVSQPTGPGSRDPRVLLNETAHRLDGCRLADFDQSRTYDTYDGQNKTAELDAYTLEFGEPVSLNCVEMTMGFPYRDGGWWTSLSLEVRAEAGAAWCPVDNLNITPPYNFDDSRHPRRAYETYALTFNDTVAGALRLVGRPGGLAQFTSLARLAVYGRDLSRWNPVSLPEPPVPYIFRLVPPHIISDLSENLVKLTGLTIGLPFMDYYLDEQRYNRRWARLRRNYEGEPELWFLVAERMGWDTWNRINVTTEADMPASSSAPYLRVRFHDTLASAIAPVVIEDQVVAEMKTHPAVLKDGFELRQHRRFADEQEIPWPIYRAALGRSPRLTREQMEGAAALMGTIVNTIAGLVHRLDTAGSPGDRRAQQRKDLARRAIGFMEEHLEAAIDVTDVAAAVALSPSHFCNLFTEETGHNPSDFLINLRLERAKEYLTYTEMSVIEVSDALGYSRSYFSRLFKQRIGCSPVDYARQARSH